jgi:CubicO group peptidase (beta-lactamase class C family)
MSFDKARLARMHDVLAGHVDRGLAPGLVSLVSRHGETHVEVIGADTRRDTVFRIASLTKPITAVATMILVEECVLRLDDPVDELLPELADRRVLSRIDAPLDDTVPAVRPITVRDLLTFRLGFGVQFDQELPIWQAATANKVATLTDRAGVTPDEWIARLGSLPLMHQPGEKWLYDTGSDVLAVLIARAAGQPFDDFLRERIFEPLGMVDTAFHLAADKLPRLAAQRGVDNEPLTDDWSTRPAFPSGGGGLLSTVDDMAAFAAMLLDRGAGLLSRPAVELMTTDQLTDAQKAVSGFMPGYFDARGWGFGVAVDTRRVNLSSVGRYGWDGGSGTTWWNDPTEGLTGILLSQRMAFPLASPLYLDFWTSVYQAISD